MTHSPTPRYLSIQVFASLFCVMLSLFGLFVVISVVSTCSGSRTCFRPSYLLSCVEKVRDGGRGDTYVHPLDLRTPARMVETAQGHVSLMARRDGARTRKSIPRTASNA